MRKTLFFSGLFSGLLLLSFNYSAAQVFTQNPTNIGGIPGGQADRLRVENGIISHRVTGVVGGLAATDHWLGLGPARIGGVFNTSIYGLRIQRLGQALLFNLDGNNGNINWGPLNNTRLSVQFIQNSPQQTQREVFRFTKTNDSTGNSFALNGLLGHQAAGNFGQFAATDQWIGIGQPFNGTAPITSLYGNRIQWNGQAFIQALRQNGTVRDAIVEWGNQGGNLRFRYITNPNDPVNGFRNLITVDTSGNALFGLQRISSFLLPKLEVNASLQQGMLVNTTNQLAGEFRARTLVNFEEGIGVQGSSTGLGFNYGGRTFAFSGTVNFGLESTASGGEAYGVYGSGFGNSFSAAGYFDGDLYAANLFTFSDGKLKKDVKNEESALARLRKLRPVNYQFITGDERTRGIGLSGGLQHGFIAQELEQVFPEMVRTARHPVRDANNRLRSSMDLKTVNYTMLIPVLTSALQEQQNIIDQLQERLSALERQVKPGAASGPAKPGEADGFSLSQNLPNPFSSTTTIRYAIPEKVKSAVLAVFDLNGKMLLQYNGLRGNAQLTINGGSLQPGMYIYSLLADGQEVLSRKMILTR